MDDRFFINLTNFKSLTKVFVISFLTRNRRKYDRDRYLTTAIDLSKMSAAASASNASQSGGGNKLAQEISDEFLTCKICLEGFTSPKSLDCLHTFCENCIENHVMSECTYKKYSDYREFTCPLCRKRTQVPLGGVKKLPDNFLLSSLSEMVQRQKPSKFPFCDICKLVNRKHREASSKCLDCSKLLCKQCVELHRETKVTKGHSLFDVEIEKDIECKEHQEEVVRFYCEPCETCICVLCTFNEHKDHEITQFSEAVCKYKESIQRLLDNCKSKIQVFDSQLSTISKVDTMIKQAEQKIRDIAIEFISEIRAKEKQLVEEVHKMYGDEMMSYITMRPEMQINLDSLKSTCNLTELVLKGKDIELLLLKKQVQEKLSHLYEVELKDLPPSITKEVVFVPGSLQLGTLQDADSSSSTRGKAGRSVSFVDGVRQDKYETRCWDSQRPTSNVSTQTETESGGSSKGNADVSFTLCAPGNHDDKSIETDSVSTVEKAVNTRSRSLHSLTNQLRKSPSRDGAPEETPDPNSAIARRHRRRRERQRPVEVSVRPTTYHASETAAPILTYSSSIDEPFYSADSNNSNASPP